MTQPHPLVLARFWSKVDVGTATQCWPWRARTDDKGYGRVTQDGETVRAHRFAFECVNGPVPEALSVLHACDNPPCCNPAHLFAGTDLDNNRDCIAKGRRRLATRATHSRAKLTEEEAAYVVASGERGVDLAARFGVAKSTISQIRGRARRAA